MVPVSYTHLDVYKRQTYNKSIGHHNFDVLLGHENSSSKYEYLYGMKTQETVSGMYEFGNFVNISSLSSYTTVSYTHLDVYKRQGAGTACRFYPYYTD